MRQWDSLRKIRRNKEVVLYAGMNPDLSLAEIAKKFKVSRQRIFSIIKRWRELNDV